MTSTLGWESSSTRPPGLAVEQDRHVGVDPAAAHLGQRPQVGAELARPRATPWCRCRRAAPSRSGTSPRRRAEARHWKNITPSAPRATCARLLRRSWPGALATLRGCQLTALVECSISSHGSPPASAAGEVGGERQLDVRRRGSAAVR